MVGKRFRSDKERDPIAELGRLIAQANSHDGSTASDNRFGEETVSDGYNETPELPPAPQLVFDLNENDQTCERDEHCPDDQAYDVDDDLCAAKEEYQDSEVPHYLAEEHQDSEVPRERRPGLTLVMGIVGLALVGTACAVGYRDVFGGLVSPGQPPGMNRKTIAPVSETQGVSSGKTREVDPAITGSIDNMVSREEQPASVGPQKAAHHTSPLGSPPATPAARQAVPNRAVPRAAPAPTPSLTIPSAPQRSGQSGGADDTSNHERLAAAPVEHANLDDSAAAPIAASGYAVQVTSERSEGRAQTAFRALQAKYPKQLSGRQPIIRRADLGAAGIYYRALVGPFASAEKAAKMCTGLKGAGGDWIVHKN
jgi:hypothetical protein